MADSKTSQADENERLRLPDLNPLLKLYPSAKGKDGAPNWILFYPASNKYYKVSWAEFECIARFHKYETAEELVEKVNQETTLEIDLEDVKTLILFLSQNGLLKPSQQIQPTQQKQKEPLWKKLVHRYLFFTIPLFQPQNFLNTAYPYIRPLISKTFWFFSLFLLLVGILLTLPKLDHFLATFTHIFSLEGLILTTIIFTLIKIVHEFGHAFMARHFNVPVPHMGVAFMVMYPVLYTEMSGTWRVSERNPRMMMGLAGVMTEIVLAALFLIYWHITPSVLGQSIAFSVVTISLLGTFLINLNPFMRFDGYYVLSDFWGIENLHQTAIAHAKNWIRRTFFGLDETIESEYSAQTIKKLILFGIGTMTYRFFLYLGIAFLVYYVFFKPLGLILMMVELLWFIAIPVFNELKYLATKFQTIAASKQGILLTLLAIIAIGLLILPTKTSIHSKAILHPMYYSNIYPVKAGKIEEIYVKNGEKVMKGMPLIRLSSEILNQDYAVAKTKLNELIQLKRREQTNIDSFRENKALIDLEITEAKQEVTSIEVQLDKLEITADFDGIVKDIPDDLHQGRFVKGDQLLMRLVNPGKQEITAYIDENDLNHIAINNTAIFSPDYALLQKTDFVISKIETTNIEDLQWKELSAEHGGTIATKTDNLSNNKTLRSYYKVSLHPKDTSKQAQNLAIVTRGRIKILGEKASPVLFYLKQFYALIIREIGLN